eukprot:scaffold18384_cov109-Cylindrotheca_fusiformis.AAC.2
MPRADGHALTSHAECVRHSTVHSTSPPDNKQSWDLLPLRKTSAAVPGASTDVRSFIRHLHHDRRSYLLVHPVNG